MKVDRDKLAELVKDERVEIAKLELRDPDTRVARGFWFGPRDYAPDVAQPRGYARPSKEGVSTIMSDDDTVDDDIFNTGLSRVTAVVEDNGFTMSGDVDDEETCQSDGRRESDDSSSRLSSSSTEDDEDSAEKGVA